MHHSNPSPSISARGPGYCNLLMLKYQPNYLVKLFVCSGKLIHGFMLIHRQQVWDPQDKLEPEHIKVKESSLTSKDFGSEAKIRYYSSALNNTFVRPSFVLVDEGRDCLFLFLFFLLSFFSCFSFLPPSFLPSYFSFSHQTGMSTTCLHWNWVELCYGHNRSRNSSNMASYWAPLWSNPNSKLCYP